MTCQETTIIVTQEQASFLGYLVNAISFAYDLSECLIKSAFKLMYFFVVCFKNTISYLKNTFYKNVLLCLHLTFVLFLLFVFFMFLFCFL